VDPLRNRSVLLVGGMHGN
jgi:predicted deacylase